MTKLNRIVSSIDYTTNQKRTNLVCKSKEAATVATSATDTMPESFHDFRDGDYSSIPDKYMPNVLELSALWTESVGDSKQLINLIENFVINRLIADGVKPPWFQHSACCKHYGPVFIDVETVGVLEGCPWCFCQRLPRFSENS